MADYLAAKSGEVTVRIGGRDAQGVASVAPDQTGVSGAAALASAGYVATVLMEADGAVRVEIATAPPPAHGVTEDDLIAIVRFRPDRGKVHVRRLYNRRGGS